MEQSHFWEATGCQIVKKYPPFYGTQRLITACTSTCHLSLSWARYVQSMPPHLNPWRSILILSSHLCLALPSGLFYSLLPIETLYVPLLTPICATCPFRLILLDSIIQMIVGEEHRLWSSALCCLLHSPIILSLLGPDIFVRTLFSAYIPTSMWETQVSHPYKNTGKDIVLYFVIFIFLDSKLNDARFCTE